MDGRHVPNTVIKASLESLLTNEGVEAVAVPPTFSTFSKPFSCFHKQREVCLGRSE